MNILKKKFRSIAKLPTWLFWLPAMLLALFRRVFFRFRIIDPFDILKISLTQPIIAVTWHNRLLYFPVCIPDAVRRRTFAVVSSSRDGQYICDLISFYHLRCLRGSSSRRGMNVQLEALRVLQEERCNVCMTPDGPRGPRYHLNPGVIQLASKTGLPIVPVAVNSSRSWSAGSWDAFRIPKPFSSLTLELGEPITVPDGMDAAAFEAKRLEVETALRVLNRVTPEELADAENWEGVHRRKKLEKMKKKQLEGKK
jgi:lysophospholipid acyltransferase (LPLAT)-like uncharacterized protein